MKKIVLAIVLSVGVMTVSAQVETFVFGGPQLSSAKYRVNGKKQSVSSKYGFQLGAGMKVPFETKLYFAPAVFYSLKGYKVVFNQVSFPPDSTAIDNNTTIHTFELAALLQYDFSQQPNHFFIKFGPSLDVQFSGKEKFSRNNGTTKEQKMVFSFTRYGRVAANLLLHLGYETKNGLLLGGQYSLGIGNMNNADFGPDIYHRAMGIFIGKKIGKKN